MSKKKERAVLVTTANRGVFFGYTTKPTDAILRDRFCSLRAARCCIYWPASNKGFLGLAAEGPHKGARVGPAVDFSPNEITSVAENISDAAIKAWEAAPWN